MRPASPGEISETELYFAHTSASVFVLAGSPGSGIAAEKISDRHLWAKAGEFCRRLIHPLLFRILYRYTFCSSPAVRFVPPLDLPEQCAAQLVRHLPQARIERACGRAEHNSRRAGPFPNFEYRRSSSLTRPKGRALLPRLSPP